MKRIPTVQVFQFIVIELTLEDNGLPVLDGREEFTVAASIPVCAYNPPSQLPTLSGFVSPGTVVDGGVRVGNVVNPFRV